MPSLLHVVRSHAESLGAKLAFQQLDASSGPCGLTYAELDRRARAVAAQLQADGATGERAVILLPQGLDFVVAFFGCLYAGVTAVPSYPIVNARHTARVHQVARDAQARFVLTDAATGTRFLAQSHEFPDLAAARWRNVDEVDPALADAWRAHAPADGDLAFLQYTSGSTGSPKGVRVTQANLMANLRQLEAAFAHDQASVFVSWLPLFHDMGLVGQMLSSAYQGASAHLMAPATFIRSPIRWLEAISTYRATMSGGPNFAYDMLASEIDEEQKARLDLSSWRSAFNGAEPIRAATLRRFAEAFHGCGLDARALYPCYGMAETTLIVTGGANAEPPVVRSVEADALERHRAIDAGQDRGARDAVSSGRAVIDSRVVIVEPETRSVLGPDHVGEIWVAGAHVADGYWNKPEETAATFAARTADGQGPYLRTGDLGFLDERGELFVVGRLKDMVILRGRNHAPQDLEWTVERAHPAIRSTFTAAFAVEHGGVEALVVVAEIERAQAEGLDLPALERAVRQALSREHEVGLFAFVAVPHGTLTKTSSGKIQRQATRRRYLAGEFSPAPVTAQ